jgi:hypothetical protein
MTCPGYEWPDDWSEMSATERQRFFDEFRERLYTFWRAQAEYEKRRSERVSEHRVEDTLT